MKHHWSDDVMVNVDGYLAHDMRCSSVQHAIDRVTGLLLSEQYTATYARPDGFVVTRKETGTRYYFRSVGMR